MYPFFHWLGSQAVLGWNWFSERPDWIQATVLFFVIAGVVWWADYDNRRMRVR